MDALFNEYAINRAVNWHGNSGWWIIETMESFNGIPDGGQGNYWYWFDHRAFGGTNYENTPVGAVCHTDEPGLPNANLPETYFGLWARGKSFAMCAWNSRRTPHFQAVGDPFVLR
jgi:hypothetical protein